MVKNYIRNDPNYKEFLEIKNQLYQEIEGNHNLSSLIQRSINYSQNFSSCSNLSEKEVKRFLAWHIYHHNDGDLNDFLEKVPIEGLDRLICEEIALFSE